MSCPMCEKQNTPGTRLLTEYERKNGTRIALAGNPNSGKTSAFNKITGANQHVGNYPGVTVEKKEGWTDADGRKVMLVDLPGTYSLTAYSLEERVTREVLAPDSADERPRAVIDVIDSGVLERGLFLAVQIREMGLPVVLACNMMDDLNGPIAAMDDASKLKLFAEVHRIVAGTPASWAVKSEDTISRQFSMLQSEEAKQQLLAEAFAAYMGAGDGTIFGQILEWAVKTYVQSGRDDVFNKAFAAATSKAAGAATGERAKKMSQAYGKAIVAAEQARSAAAFSALSAAAQKTCPPDVRPPKLQAQLPPGIGKGVLFRMSTTSGFDDPVAHALVLTPQGGRCHTDREAHPHMIVELDAKATVTGCLVHKVPGNEGRMKRAKISTSTDGATWFDQEKTDNMPSEWVVKFKPGTQAKWVRIEFDNPQPEFAHISHFLIFTK